MVQEMGGCLITATGLAVDRRSGETFVTHLALGTVTRLNTAGLIPPAPPTGAIPAWVG